MRVKHKRIVVKPPGETSLEAAGRLTDVDGLAGQYLVSRRSIENWIAEGILPRRRLGRKLMFDVEGTSRRLFTRQPKDQAAALGRSTQHKETPMDKHCSTPRPYSTARELTERYGVTRRTITKWKTAGILVYFQVGKVVRFDVLACDSALRRFGYRQ